MRLSYDKSTDSLYIELRPLPANGLGKLSRMFISSSARMARRSATTSSTLRPNVT